MADPSRFQGIDQPLLDILMSNDVFKHLPSILGPGIPARLPNRICQLRLKPDAQFLELLFGNLRRRINHHVPSGIVLRERNGVPDGAEMETFII